MTKKYTEIRFEEWIEQSLLNNGFNHSFIHNQENEHLFDKDLCLLNQECLDFIKTTQKDSYEKLQTLKGTETDNIILKRIDEMISKRGVISVLRDGISTSGCDFNLVYFKPKSKLNPVLNDLYQQNRFLVVRQLHYSKKNRNSVDMVLFLNGIPLITLELKNQLTGQDISNSEKQYRYDRDPKEPLFQFKRCLVHFCVDNNRVSMTTRLMGVDTRFLPYNKGIDNPEVENNYRSEYLWNEILVPDSILDILENFVVLTTESDKEWSDSKNMVIEKKTELLIFPRYHQLEVIRKLKSKIVEEGVGYNYLIQHTTGSGKSYEIGWLSHTLTSLYQNETDKKRMFDTILVLTDRKVLDKQLQGTISKLEQTGGVVNNVDVNSQQLKEYLEKGKDIIVSTIQKFPIICETISQLKGRTFGVIIDEVHSSQSGETSRKIKKILTQKEGDDGDDDSTDLEDLIMEDIKSRGRQDHISYFGFTGTPKEKTLELFGRKNDVGEFVSFHYYTMKQSIMEGFTLDVLQNYTTYKRYFNVLLKDSSQDQSVPKSKVMKELVNYVDSHKMTISQKVSIILDHFIRITSKKIDGKGRGMVVVRSRKHCVLFQEEMVKQMKEKGLPYTCLVGFSGTIYHNGRENTETSLNIDNGLQSQTSIPDGLKDPRYRILIVSNKFQTGFDEPLLVSMYVDKKLSGVQCVQTLSRLNRTKRGKTDTFVLDFVNQPEDIIESFQPYFTTTILSGETNPDKLYDVLYEIEQYNLYTKYQVDEFCKEYYSKSQTDEKLQPIIEKVVDVYKEKLSDEEKDTYKSLIQSYIRLYSYISQITKFGVVDWEKSFVFLRFLNKMIPKGKETKLSIIDSVDLDSLRISMKSDSTLSLTNKEGELSPIGMGTSQTKDDEEPELLSEIIKKVNQLYGMELGEDDKLTMEKVYTKVSTNVELNKVMVGNNTDDVKMDFFSDIFKSEMVDYYGDRMDFYRKVMDKKVFPLVIETLYRTFNKRLNG